MREKLRSLIFSEAGKYLIAGGLTTLLNLAVFNILLSAFPKMPHDAANAISIICAVLFAYVINSAYVFRKKVFLLYTCVNCGKEATLYTTGWILPVCDECAKEIRKKNPNERFRKIE